MGQCEECSVGRHSHFTPRQVRCSAKSLVTVAREGAEGALQRLPPGIRQRGAADAQVDAHRQGAALPPQRRQVRARRCRQVWRRARQVQRDSCAPTGLPALGSPLRRPHAGGALCSCRAALSMVEACTWTGTMTWL